MRFSYSANHSQSINGEAISNSLNDFIIENEIGWSKRVGVSGLVTVLAQFYYSTVEMFEPSQ
jgi:hypothetical protein